MGEDDWRAEEESESDEELTLPEDYLSFALFAYFKSDADIAEEEREFDTITEGSLQGQIMEITEYIRRQQNMDVFFKSVLLEVCSFTVAICVFYHFNISQEAGDVEPEMYKDSICRLVFCLVAHLIMQV